MAAELSNFVPLAIPAAVAAWFLYKKFRKPRDISIPEPAQLRKGLLYGYYGTVNTQATDTLGKVNLLWESQFDGRERSAENILTCKTFTVLDLGWYCFEKFAPSGRNYRLKPNFEQEVRDILSYFHSREALQYVKVLVVMDEPNINVVSAEQFQTAIDTVKRVSLEFPELANVKWAVIYAAKPIEFWCIEQFDYVGVDDYDAKSEIFVNGVYDSIKSRMRPDAKTIILPGGGFGQNIVPFWNFAHNNAEVGMLVPFTWLDGPLPEDKWIGLGNDKNPRKQQYLDYGKINFDLNS